MSILTKKNTRIRNRNGHQKAHILYVTNDMRGLILYSRPTSTARSHVIDCSNGGCVRACAIYCTLYAGTVFFLRVRASIGHAGGVQCIRNDWTIRLEIGMNVLIVIVELV